MPQSSSTHGLQDEARASDGRPLGYGTGDGSTVTQATSITTGVEINANSGTITTVSSVLATGVDATFTVTNDKIEANDTPIVVTKSYGGTADGIPTASVSAVADGSFDVNIRNQGAVTLDAVIVLSFSVIKGSAS